MIKTKAVLFDLDDTLTDSKQKMTEEMALVFGKLLEIIPVAIVTGGMFSQIKNQVIDLLSNDTKFSNLYIFPQNAAECILYKDNNFYSEYSYAFKDEEIEKIIEALNQVLEETGFVKDQIAFGERIENRGAQVTFSALGQQAPLDLKYKWDKDQVKRKIMREKLLKIIPEYEIGIGGATSIDITHKNINKTLAIKWMSEHLSCEPEDITYIGDALFEGGNDAVVIPTGVRTIETKNAKYTINIIENFLH